MPQTLEDHPRRCRRSKHLWNPRLKAKPNSREPAGPPAGPCFLLDCFLFSLARSLASLGPAPHLPTHQPRSALWAATTPRAPSYRVRAPAGRRQTVLHRERRAPTSKQ